MDIPGIIDTLMQSGELYRTINNPMAQFGPPTAPLLGATLLPNRNVDRNEYREENIQYRTVLANHSTRYSPVQLKRGLLTGWMEVALADQDIGSELKAVDYDAFIRLLSDSNQAMPGDMSAMAQVLGWADRTLTRPLEIVIEKMRWEALIDASVVRTGDDNFSETVGYPDPTGHRVNAGGTWSSDAYDPYLDFMTAMDFLAAKGYTVGRIITSTPVMAILAKNANIRTRVGRITVAAGTVVGLPGRASRQEINAMISEDGLPPIEVYDQQFRTQNGSGFYLKRNVMAFISTTGRDASIDRADLEPLTVPDTLGYCGIGVNAGRTASGRSVVLDSFITKPPRIEGSAWQVSLPVVQDPEAIYVIKTIA